MKLNAIKELKEEIFRLKIDLSYYKSLVKFYEERFLCKQCKELSEVEE